MSALAGEFEGMGVHTGPGQHGPARGKEGAAGVAAPRNTHLSGLARLLASERVSSAQPEWDSASLAEPEAFIEQQQQQQQL